VTFWLREEAFQREDVMALLTDVLTDVELQRMVFEGKKPIERE
jgi:hypothetical protein